MNILCLQALSLALALALSLALEGEGEGLKAQDVFGSAAGSPKFLARRGESAERKSSVYKKVKLL
jgi:hypothetical protein